MSARIANAGPAHAGPGERRTGRETRGILARLGALFRTTAFKLSLAYLLVFAAFAFFALGYVAWNARRVLDDQIVSTIEAEINGLSDQYAAGGIRRLVGVVERRSREPGASLYLVTTPAGEHVAGNVEALPPGTLAEPGQTETAYARNTDNDRLDHRAIVRIFTLPGASACWWPRRRGARPPAGGDRAGLRLVADAGGELGFLGSWFIAQRVLKRVDQMTDITRTIMAGDLDGRLTLAGTGDELDRLARNLNAMLDRIGELMRGMREVSDNIAHDLKTPLTRLRNKADAALREGNDPDALAGGPGGQYRGERQPDPGVQRAPDDRPPGGRQRSSRRAGGIRRGAVALEVAELYEAVAEERGIALTAEVEDGLKLHGSRELIGQAMANLIDNALKYGQKTADPAAEPVLRVAARREEGEIVLSVADRGEGIPEAERGRVLERFVRLETARHPPDSDWA